MKISSPLLSLILCTSTALAEPPTPVEKVQDLVQDRVLRPLARSQSKRSKFSRVAPIPVTRRVRVLDRQEQTDPQGRKFVRFAVDEKRFDWVKGRLEGCAYPADGRVYVRHKGQSEFFPAAGLLGRKTRPDTDACRPARAATAHRLKPSPKNLPLSQRPGVTS